MSIVLQESFPASLNAATPITLTLNGATYTFGLDPQALKAAAGRLGLVKIGDGLDIASDGTLSTPLASTLAAGISKPGDTLKVASGVLDISDTILSQITVTEGVKSRASVPPGSPAIGDRYIIKSGATGAFSGRAGQIAEWSGGAWAYMFPAIGAIVLVGDEWQIYGWNNTLSVWIAITSAAIAKDTLANLTTAMATAVNGAEGHVTNDIVATVATRARASNVATLVTPAPHGLAVGAAVNVRGAGGSGYNGRFTTVAGTTGSTIVYNSTGGNESTTADTGGQVDRNGVYSSDGAGTLTWIGDLNPSPQVTSAISAAVAAEASARDAAIAAEAALRVAADQAVRNYVDDQFFLATLPAGSDAVWAFDRLDAATKAVQNLLSSTALSPNIHRAPRRLFSKANSYYSTNGTVSDDAVVAEDGTQEASTVALAASQTLQINTGVLPAGTYTLVGAFKRNAVTDQQFRFGSDASSTYTTFTAGASWARCAFTFILGSSANPLLIVRTIDGSTPANLQVVDLELFAGSADLGKSAIDSHIYLGKNRYDTATTGSYASGKLDISSGGFGLAQFPSSKSYSKFTAHWLCSKKTTGGNYQAFLSRVFNFGNFTLYNELTHALTVAIGGESNPGYISQRANVPRALTSDGFHSFTVRYDDPTLDIWFDDFLLLRVSTSPQHGVGTLVPQSIRDLYFGIVSSFDNGSGYEYAGFSTIHPRALTDAEVRVLHSANTARAAKSSVAMATVPERIYIAEGDSLSSPAYNSYPAQLLPNHNKRTYTAIHAVTGSFISSMTTRGPYADAAIKPVGVRGSEVYILSVMIGTNDFTSGSFDQTAWLASYASYLDARRAAGFKVIVGTVIANSNATVNTRRAAVNAVLRTWVGTHCDAIADFAADAIMGADASASNATYFVDGIHPTDAGQAILEGIIRPVINAF